MENHRILNASTAEVIEELLKIRNNLISELLDDNGLKNFLEKEFDMIALSPIKVEFLKRDLKELQRSSLDLVHYAGLIKLIKETGANAQQSNLFLNEIRTVFQKYIVK